jgi:dihydrofolate reductase
LAAQSELRRAFADAWQGASKVVYSTTRREPTTARTRVERTFDPDAVRDLKASATGELTVGGANFAAHAFRAGLVDECHLFIAPVSLGGGKAALPRDTRVHLELLDERSFDNGVVYVRHRVRS